MINDESFTLYDKLVKEDNYKYLFDITIIYQVNNYLECLQAIIDEERSTKNFKAICNEVKRRCLVDDREINDSLIDDIYNKIIGVKNDEL